MKLHCSWPSGIVSWLNCFCLGQCCFQLSISSSNNFLKQLVLQLYLSKHAEKDTYDWTYNHNAQYTVRSGYWVATHVNLQENEVIYPLQGSVELKKKIWKLKIAPKIQHFLWRYIRSSCNLYPVSFENHPCRFNMPEVLYRRRNN